MINFKKIFGFVCICPFILSNVLIAPGLTNETKIEEQKLLLWRVDPQDENLYSVYILGTYHIGKNCQLRSRAFEHAFNDAETVVFELDSMLDPNLGSEIQNSLIKMIREQGVPENPSQSLKGILDTEAYEVLKQKANDMDLQIESISHFKPWVFMMMYWSFQMAAIEQTSQTPYRSECGLDEMIAQKSQTVNKNVTGFETMEYSVEKLINLFISMDLEETINTLKAIAKTDFSENITEYTEYIYHEFDAIVDHIDSGNVEYIESLIKQSCEDDAKNCDSLLYERNHNWMPEIEQMLEQKQDSLVVVGAGHLVGEQGLIQLLKQKGYRVRRFYNNFRLTEE